MLAHGFRRDMSVSLYSRDWQTVKKRNDEDQRRDGQSRTLPRGAYASTIARHEQPSQPLPTEALGKSLRVFRLCKGEPRSSWRMSMPSRSSAAIDTAALAEFRVKIRVHPLAGPSTTASRISASAG
jgi:hypothetical protein